MSLVQLLNSTAQPFVSNEKVTDQGTVLIRGLFTTDNLDREREFVDPLQMNLDVFNTTGTLLRNHEFIKDAVGNKEAAGKVLKTIPVVISQENPENSSEWVLKSLLSDDIVALWPKEQSPNLLVGDRAVHIVAEVTHPKVVQQVLNKELRAFSWRGLSVKVQHEESIKELTQVDILEISLVNIPGNPDATFVLTDENDPTLDMEVSLKDCNIYRMGFDKSLHTLETIKEYTKKYTDTYNISESSDKFFVQIGEPNLVDVTKSFLIDVGSTCLVIAPKIEESKKTTPIVGVIDTTNVILENTMSEKEQVETDAQVETPAVDAEKFYLVDIETLKSRLPEAVSSLQNATTINGQPAEFHLVEFPAAAPAEVVAKEAPAEEAPVEEASVEAPAEPSKLDQLTSVVESLVAAMAANAAKKEEEVLEVAEVAKSADEIKEEMRQEFEETLKSFKAEEAEMETRREKLQASLAKIAAFENVVPAAPQREEKVESSKSVETVTDEVSSVDFFANAIMKGIN